MGNLFSEPRKQTPSDEPQPSGHYHINDVGAEACPSWIPERLSLVGEPVPCVEILGASGNMYGVLKDYMYHRAVDVSEEIPESLKPEETLCGSAVSSTEEDTDSPSGVPVSQGGDDAALAPHQISPGMESADLMPPDTVPGEDFGPCIELDEEEEYTEAELRAAEKTRALNDREYPGTLSSLSCKLSSVPCVPRKTVGKDGKKVARDTLAANFFFGLGYAHTKHNDNLIIARHQRRPAPDGSSAILLYAKTPEILKEFCKHARHWHFEWYRPEVKAKSGKYMLYLLDVMVGGKGRWRMVGQRESRSLKSIVLREGQLKAIIADVKEFQAKGTRKWYSDRGLPHRRSYMFYGPPGVGKTSTIRAMAGELKLNACFLSLSDNHFQNKTLVDAVMNLPKPSMLVLEDIDVLFNESRKSETQSLVTFSGLLNALDGLVSADGILTVMTTNHPERLDPALTRAGRVDRRFEFQAPDREQMKNYFLSFYPSAGPKLAKEFADLVFARPEKEARSIATVQEHFICTRNRNAEESVAAVNEFFDEFYPHSKNESAPSYTM